MKIRKEKERTVEAGDGSGPSNSDSDNEVKRDDNGDNVDGYRRTQRQKYNILIRKQRKLLEKQLNVALRKKKLQLEFMKKEIEMKRQLHQLKMQMLRSELEYKKQVLALMNEETEGL